MTIIEMTEELIVAFVSSNWPGMLGLYYDHPANPDTPLSTRAPSRFKASDIFGTLGAAYLDIHKCQVRLKEGAEKGRIRPAS